MYRILIVLSVIFFLSSCQTSMQNKKQPKNSDHWLEGTWTAPYFAGQIAETWSFDEKGFLNLDGIYKENWDTLYWEKIKIDTLGEDVFLIAKPHNAPGFIYQQISVSDKEIIFENKIYGNPYRIKYLKIDNDHFERVTTGKEEGEEVIGQFNYTRHGKEPLAGAKKPQIPDSERQFPVMDQDVNTVPDIDNK